MKNNNKSIKKIFINKKSPEYQAGFNDGYGKGIEDYKQKIIKYFATICVVPEIKDKEKELLSWENKNFLFGMENPFTMKDFRRLINLK